jgi:hypothetical protein
MAVVVTICASGIKEKLKVLVKLDDDGWKEAAFVNAKVMPGKQ